MDTLEFKGHILTCDCNIFLWQRSSYFVICIWFTYKGKLF